MTENQPYKIDPLWNDDNELAYKNEIAEVRRRREEWQPRYEQFLENYKSISSDTGYSVVYSADYTGQGFPWMTPDNLSDYILFRLDMMERQGGSDAEKHWQAEIAASGGGAIFQDGAHLVETRVLSLSPEIAYWGQESLTDLHQVQRALRTPPPPGPGDVVLGFRPGVPAEPPTVLTPQQSDLVNALRRRSERYNDPRWQRWTRKAAERRPGTSSPRPGPHHRPGRQRA